MKKDPEPAKGVVADDDAASREYSYVYTFFKPAYGCPLYVGSH